MKIINSFKNILFLLSKKSNQKISQPRWHHNSTPEGKGVFFFPDVIWTNVNNARALLFPVTWRMILKSLGIPPNIRFRSKIIKNDGWSWLLKFRNPRLIRSRLVISNYCFPARWHILTQESWFLLQPSAHTIRLFAHAWTNVNTLWLFILKVFFFKVLNCLAKYRLSMTGCQNSTCEKKFII